MKEFYELKDDYDKVHIIINKQGYGKTYYEKNKYKKQILDELVRKIKSEVIEQTKDCDIDEKMIVGKVLTIIDRVRWDI